MRPSAAGVGVGKSNKAIYRDQEYRASKNSKWT